MARILGGPLRLNERPAEVEPDPDYRSRLRRDSAFFFKTRIRTRSQKFVKSRTRIRSHFSISAVARVCAAEMITIRFAGWISGRIVSLEPDADIQKLLSNGNRIRIWISETVLPMFRGFRLLEKVAHCTIIHSLASGASFQPSVP